MDGPGEAQELLLGTVALQIEQPGAVRAPDGVEVIKNTQIDKTSAHIQLDVQVDPPGLSLSLRWRPRPAILLRQKRKKARRKGRKRRPQVSRQQRRPIDQLEE